MAQKHRSSTLLFIFIASIFITTYGQEDEEQDWIFNNSKSLSEEWELDDEYHKGTFLITSYKPIYISLAKLTTDTNNFPQAENSSLLPAAPVALNPIEVKFQLSLKTKIIHNMLNGHMDLWLAYTQKAHWQIYNSKLSRPFRELNYQPEIIANFPVAFPLLGFDAKMVGLALVHESNGQSDPISRSWNRIIFHAGFERNNWQVLLRPWIRLGDKIDNNEDITDFVGRGEAELVYDWRQQRFTAIVRNSLRFGSTNRGSVQLNWSFPIIKNFNGHIQFFDGYGETLIDYNHRQTVLGFGVSLIN